ncbi:MAG: ferritin [Candidatus Sericytochromatia bacterium]|nr:ferritin [Candidatus Sericytochromatia bacterium]
MLSQELTDQLNHQLSLEFFSANLYLQMSSWCHSHGLDGCGTFLRQQADEERLHMEKFFDYINDAGGYAVIGAIEQPPHTFGTVSDVFEQIYAHECKITKEINQLLKAAFEAGDFSTFGFLQYFALEQNEEERLFQSILDKIKLIKVEQQGLYLFDKEIASMSKQLQSASSAA